MNDITVIIPIHEYNDEINSLLSKAIASVPNDIPLVLSCAPNVVSELQVKDYGQKNVSFVMDEDTSFQSLVNKAVEKVETKYFSILEFDDIYTDIWFDNVAKYMKFYPEISIFLPLTDLYDFQNEKYLGYGNDAAWASSFSEEIGYIDHGCLENFFDFYLTGSIFNTDDWKKIGGLKKSMKLTFWYEFLLRATNNDKKIYVIPKVGYIHNLNRKDSLINIFSETLTEEESGKWVELAKQEQYFTEDRNKTIE